MKNKLDKLNYSEFIQHLNSNSIEYKENKYKDFLSDMVEVHPIIENYPSRNFHIKEGKQERKEIHSKKRTRLNLMNYDEYITYLNDTIVRYEEYRDWDFFLLDYITIYPKSKKLKDRMFFADGGDQAFEGDYVEL